ncbi:amidoligase family protein, partial [Novipirellula rosea]|uniref:amidoligase family protein n=1 Tax=Novipirellula rosea TaxID=1031540 RepID=UPI0031EB0008
MHANDIAFGIEIETHMPGNDATPIGGYHNGLPVAWLPAGWTAERDSSIRTPAGRKPCEFVSPVLRGHEGLRTVETAVDAIRDRGARVNESCGLHITISWNGDAAALARLISLIANHEKAIYASTGTRRRERNQWAKQIKTYGTKEAAKTRCERDRYHLLNLT